MARSKILTGSAWWGRRICGKLVWPLLVNQEMDHRVIHHDFLQIDLPPPDRYQSQSDSKMVGPE